MTYDIQLNESGTHHLALSETSLDTLRRYQLLDHILDSTGYVTEDTLDRLKMQIRALIASSTENTKDLLDLCIDVIYHHKMKAYGLRELIAVYQAYVEQVKTQEAATDCAQ
jgi:hypothetical protein